MTMHPVDGNRTVRGKAVRLLLRYGISFSGIAEAFGISRQAVSAHAGSRSRYNRIYGLERRDARITELRSRFEAGEISVVEFADAILKAYKEPLWTEEEASDG